LTARAPILERSSAGIDTGKLDGPATRITNELSEITDGVAIVESFSHVVAFETGAGLLLFDTSSPENGRAVLSAVRGWSTAPVDTVVYTHGHVDHVGGSPDVLADASDRSAAPPSIIGHANIGRRLARYRRMDGWNRRINARQFGPVDHVPGIGFGSGTTFLPPDVAECTTTYTDTLTVEVGGLTVELHHAEGETDDHSWAWIPEHRAVCTGDLLTWIFPNAGNPQKVQRFPEEWATALRAIAAKEPELLLPAHGLPIVGRDRIALVIDEVAGVLERLVDAVVEAMNQGASLDEIVHSVGVDASQLARPWLSPIYDEPEFVVRNIWRLFGGWWDGNPAHLKPAKEQLLASEIVALAGGVTLVVARALQLGRSGDLRLACELVELAWSAAPADPDVRSARAAIYRWRARSERSLMARGIYTAAAEEAKA